MSRLSSAEFAALLISEDEIGSPPPCPRSPTYRLSERSALPVDFSWQEEEGVLTPIRNQDPCGTCGAFAICAALESSILIHTVTTSIDLSEQHLTLCAGGSCLGVSPGAALT